MVEIEVRYEGDLRCVATHGPSGTELATDAPVDNEGRGESFSPTDLCATSLATCTLTILGIHARRRGIELEGARARLVKEMASAPRRIARLVLEIRMPPAVPAQARPALEEAARSCPVALSLHPGIVTDLAILYPD